MPGGHVAVTSGAGDVTVDGAPGGRAPQGEPCCSGGGTPGVLLRGLLLWGRLRDAAPD